MENDLLVKSISGKDRDLGTGGNMLLISTKRELRKLLRQHFTWFFKSNCDKEEREIKHLWNIQRRQLVGLRLTKKYLKYFSKYSRSQYTRACFRRTQECKGEGMVELPISFNLSEANKAAFNFPYRLHTVCDLHPRSEDGTLVLFVFQNNCLDTGWATLVWQVSLGAVPVTYEKADRTLTPMASMSVLRGNLEGLVFFTFCRSAQP